MGPSRLFQKNKSQHSLLNTQEANSRSYAASPTDTPQESPGFPPPNAGPGIAGAAVAPLPPSSYDESEEPVDAYNHPYRSEELQYYNSPPPPQVPHHGPTRSQSQRSPVSINTNQPTIHLVRPSQGYASTPASAIEPDEPDRYYYDRAPIPPAQKERKSKRSFFGFSSSREQTGPPPVTTNKLGRSRSVRAKELYPEQQLVEAPRGHRHQPSNAAWTTTHVSPTTDDEEDEDGGTGLHPSHLHSSPDGPDRPDKDPFKSPAFPPPLSHQDYTHGKSQSVSVVNQGNRQPERQGIYNSWERANQQQATNPDPNQAQTPGSYHISPSSATSIPAQQFHHHKSPSDVFRENLQDDSRPSSRQSLEPPYQSQHSVSHHTRGSSSQVSSASYMQGSMGPPPNQPPSMRRGSSDDGGPPRGQSREGNYQPYSQNIQGSGIPNAPPPQYSAGLAPQGPGYRGGSQSSPMTQQGNIAEQDRRSPPPPSRSRDDLSNLDVNQLIARHDELRMASLSFPSLRRR